jgi:DNA-binding CsgD family transcriptional regulator
MTLAAAGLTTREQEVVALVIEGLPTKLIARRLSLSVYTVQDHLRVVFDKLGVRSKQELVAQVFFRDTVRFRSHGGRLPSVALTQ